MKLACAKCLYLLMSAAFLLISTNSFADTTSAAQAALGQSTTNSFCSAGYNKSGYEDTEQFKKDQFKNGCPAGMSYVECLRKSWKENK